LFGLLVFAAAQQRNEDSLNSFIIIILSVLMMFTIRHFFGSGDCGGPSECLLTVQAFKVIRSVNVTSLETGLHFFG